MNALRALLLAGLLALSPGGWALEVVSAEFGVFDASDPEQVVFTESNVVPRREGQRYGWTIELRGAGRAVGVREEYLLPSAAKEKISESRKGTRVTIPVERRRQVSQRQIVPVAGRIWGEWTLTPDDPPGPRRLEVIVEGQKAATFDFEVE
ncbi:MAG: hypothetical protein LBS70_02030 [Candidatus Accumulibacter sp.]|jgi:hypothetical protein|nr:hypothetical protein [Accumulibacter sp.]